MQQINWNQFGQKAESKQQSFEDLCMFLCCRELGITKIEAYQNQPGIESEPFIVNGKRYGFQAKFFEAEFSWEQIKGSVNKAIEKYPELNKIYIYSNKDRTQNPRGNTKTKTEIELENNAIKKKIELEYITDKEIRLKLSRPSNFDLAQLFFGAGDEFSFIKNSISPDNLTFLQSAEYLNLPFVDKAQNELPDTANTIYLSKQKEFLLSGHPGSGKSVFMHKLLQIFGGLDKENETEMIKVLTDNKAVPILVNLKNCATDSLENILRGRKNDCKVNNQELGFIYLFDGLDELSEENADNVLSQIYELSYKHNSKKIVISCRSGNLNKIKARTFFNKITEYQIAGLEEAVIDKYFEAKKDRNKRLKLKELKKTNETLVNDIKDIFLIKLLWDTIEELNDSSTIIDLFSKKIDLLLEHPKHRKNIVELNLPNPKKEEIIKLNQDISYEFQKEFQFRFSQEKLLDLIMKRFERLDYRSANIILNYLADLFFEDSYLNTTEKSTTYIYQHRRYQEFFFAQKLKAEYEKNPKILRELNVLGNREFFEELFLKYVRKEYEKETNLAGLIELNLIDVYLGKHKGWGTDEFYYLNSSEFIPSLVKQSIEVFNELLEDENLRIKDKIKIDFQTIEILNKNDKEYLLDEQIISFKKWFNKKDKSETKYKNQLVYDQFESFLYCTIIRNKEDVEVVFHDLVRGNYKNLPEKTHHFMEEGKEKFVKSFFRVCLKENPSKLFKLIDDFDEYEFVAFLDVLKSPEFLPIFIQSQSIHSKLQSLIQNLSILLIKENSFILFYKKFLGLQISEDEVIFAENELIKMMHERRIDWRINRTEINFSLLSFVLDKYSFDEFLKKQDGYFDPYYNEAGLYAALFRDYIDLLKQQKSIESITRNFIRYINIYDDIISSKLYLQYSISSIWVNIFANSMASVETQIALKTRLLRPENKIIPFNFFFLLNLLGKQIFNKIVNESELAVFETELLDWNDDFQSYVDRCFNLAQLFSDLNPDKAIFYISKGINDGIIRHGWRKDPIVDWHLVNALEILWKNNWYSKEKLRESTLKVFELGKRASKITDDATDGPYNILKLLSKYDIELAEQLLSETYYDLANSAISSVLQGKIKLGLSLEEIEEEMDKYQKHYDSGGKPSSNYYEEKFTVYLTIVESDFYTDDEKKEAFEKAYKQVEEMQIQNLNYYLSDRNFLEEKLKFQKLCEKYGREFNLSFEGSEEPEKSTKTSEEKFIEKVKTANTERQIKGLYKNLKNYQNRIVLKNLESWEILINKTFEIFGNIQVFTEYLKDNYFPHTDFWTANSSYFHLALSIALKNINTRQEILRYLFDNTGHGGFINVMKAYEVNKDKKMCLSLFERHLRFCDFLLN